jgi:hypothetical protein
VGDPTPTNTEGEAVAFLLIAVAGWLAVGGIASLVMWRLLRSAALTDRDEASELELVEAVGVGMSWPDRRAEQRRSSTRPWATASPGRRAEDRLRKADLDEAARAFDEEKNLSNGESRESA